MKQGPWKTTIGLALFSMMKLLSSVIVYATLMTGCSEPQSEYAAASEAGLDGHILESGTVDTASDNMRVGDNSSNARYRGFLSFDLRSLDPGSGKKIEVERARLSVTMLNFNLEPFENLGPVDVQIVDYGTSLAAGDFNAIPIESCGQLSSGYDDYLETVTLDVTEAYRNYVDSEASGAYRPQFRLQHLVATTNDSELDVTNWATADYDYADWRPRLDVIYTVVDR